MQRATYHIMLTPGLRRQKGVPPATLAEFNLGAGGTDFYDGGQLDPTLINRAEQVFSFPRRRIQSTVRYFMINCFVPTICTIGCASITTLAAGSHHAPSTWDQTVRMNGLERSTRT
jgi:hypothetical protein